MKKIQREEKIYKDIYVSKDGKEFDSEAACKQWEKSYEGTLTASWNLIEKIPVCDGDLGIPWSSEDHECYVLKPKNLDEITLINAYISCTTSDSGGLTAQNIGNLILLNFGYDHDYCDAYVLSDHVKKISDYISKLENDIQEKLNK